MSRISLILAIFACAFFNHSKVFAECHTASAKTLDIEQIEDLERWLDPILEGKLKNAVLVKVWTGESEENGGRASKPSPLCRYGILLSDSDKHFRIFDLISLQKLSFVKFENTDQPHLRVAYERATLKQVKKQVFNNLDDAFFPGFSIPPAQRALIACLSYRAGQTDEAIKLIDEIPNADGNNQSAEKIKRLIAEDFSGTWVRAALLKFSDTSIGYAELMQPFRQVVKHFPETENARNAKESLEILGKMIQEEKAYAKQLTARKHSGIKPTEKQQIADLIFQLRSQKGERSCLIIDRNERRLYTDMYHARCDIFFDPRGEQSPAHQLLKLGETAIPQLINALEDERFTRSLDDDETVLRVCDCAADIISQIAGRRFDHLNPQGGVMMNDGQSLKTKAMIKKWWGEYQRKGRKQMLIEGTARGDSDSLYQFDRLIAEYPDAVVPPMIEGAKNTHLADVYTTFIRQLGSMNDDSSLKFLNSEFESESRLVFRPLLAVQLMNRKQEDIVARMIAQFEKIVSNAGVEKKLFEQEPFGGNTSAPKTTEKMLEFLMASNHPKAIKVIADNFGNLVVEDRLSLLRCMVDSAPSGNNRQTMIPKKFRYKKGDPHEFDAAYEHFLHQVLSDTERRTRLQMGLNGYRFKDPRICDFAAYALAKYFPSKYKYPRNPSDEERESIRQQFLKQRGN